MSRHELITMEREITGQLQRLAVDIAGGPDAGRVLWQAAEWGDPHPLMTVFGPIATPLLMARDALMSEWLARSGEDTGPGLPEAAPRLLHEPAR